MPGNCRVFYCGGWVIVTALTIFYPLKWQLDRHYQDAPGKQESAKAKGMFVSDESVEDIYSYLAELKQSLGEPPEIQNYHFYYKDNRFHVIPFIRFSRLRPYDIG